MLPWEKEFCVDGLGFYSRKRYYKVLYQNPTAAPTQKTSKTKRIKSSNRKQKQENNFLSEEKLGKMFSKVQDFFFLLRYFCLENFKYRVEQF